MIDIVLCDIEGTTTDLAFVQKILFPISREKMPSFIRNNWNEPEIRQIAETIAKDPEAVIATLVEWIDADKKDARLKIIQGKIWKESFESGAIRAHVYPDVPAKWNEWKQRGIQIYIFSSGSVEAQRLLFQHSDFGDLTQWIDGYFDTSIGSKKEIDSYRKIVAHLNISPDHVLFLSDIPQELEAAGAAGMQVCQIVRKGSTLESPKGIAKSFEEVAV